MIPLTFGNSYLIEVDASGIPTTDMGYTLIQALKFREWYSAKSNPSIRAYVSTIEDITDPKLVIGKDTHPALTHDIVPVGSLEYVEKWVQIAFKKPSFTLKVTNIPKELLKQEYTGRSIWDNLDTFQLAMVFSGKVEQIFVKSRGRNKKFSDIIYSNQINLLDPNDRYFVSSVVDIAAEWRTFIFKEQVVGIHQYMGNGYERVDIHFIEKMVKDYKSAPKAYTLDIALTSTGQYVLIESHNFISVGLYGFEDYSKLIPMTIAGYRYELGDII